MSEKIEDGGPAFPFQSLDPRGDPNSPSEGMSLRDWFAGHALAGMLADHEYNPEPNKIARDCYTVADAMLKARLP